MHAPKANAIAPNVPITLNLRLILRTYVLFVIICQPGADTNLNVSVGVVVQEVIARVLKRARLAPALEPSAEFCVTMITAVY